MIMVMIMVMIGVMIVVLMAIIVMMVLVTTIMAVRALMIQEGEDTEKAKLSVRVNSHHLPTSDTPANTKNWQRVSFSMLSL